jgi:hypothetical protein
MVTATQNGDFDNIQVSNNLESELVLILTNDYGGEKTICLDKKSSQELIKQIKNEIVNLK